MFMGLSLEPKFSVRRDQDIRVVALAFCIHPEKVESTRLGDLDMLQWCPRISLF